jgi:hypothetical protein
MLDLSISYLVSILIPCHKKFGDITKKALADFVGKDEYQVRIKIRDVIVAFLL